MQYQVRHKSFKQSRGRHSRVQLRKLNHYKWESVRARLATQTQRGLKIKVPITLTFQNLVVGNFE